MDSLSRAVRDFFASPPLLTSATNATPASTSAAQGSGSNTVSTAAGASLTPTSSASHWRDTATHPVAVSSSGAVVASTATHSTSIAKSIANHRTVQIIYSAMGIVLQWVRRNAKGIVAVVLFFLAAKAVKYAMQSYRQMKRNKQSRSGGTILVPINDSDSDELSPEDITNILAASRLSNPSISDVSTVRGTPRRRLESLLPEGVSETVTRDENGRLYVLQRNGEYIEVWEADEYGQVKDATMSGVYGDPDEQCEELLGHFSREASMIRDAVSSSSAAAVEVSTLFQRDSSDDD